MLPPSIGGTEIVVWRLFREDTHLVVVSGTTPEASDPPEGIYGHLGVPTLPCAYPRLRGYRYGLGTIWSAFAVGWLTVVANRVTRFLSRHSIEQIVSIPHHGPFALLGALVARKLRVPHTFYILDAWEEVAIGFAERKLIKAGLRAAAKQPGARLAAVSPWLAGHYERTYGFSRSVWIPNPGPLSDEMTGSTAMDPEPTVVLSGGIKSFNYDAIVSVVRAITRCKVVRKMIILGPAVRFAETLRSWGPEYDRVECMMVPREKVASIQQRAAVLLIATNVDDHSLTASGYLPGRLPEYVTARRPILFVGPERSEAARAVRHWELGRTLATQDEPTIAAALDDLATLAMRGEEAPLRNFNLFLEVFSRAEARRRLLGDADSVPDVSADAAALATAFERPFDA